VPLTTGATAEVGDPLLKFFSAVNGAAGRSTEGLQLESACTLSHNLIRDQSTSMIHRPCEASDLDTGGWPTTEEE